MCEVIKEVWGKLSIKKESVPHNSIKIKKQYTIKNPHDAKNITQFSIYIQATYINHIL